MRYFQVRYASRVVIYERKMFKRLATGLCDARVVSFFLKNGPSLAYFLVYFCSIKTQIKRKNCRRQWDSNSDR